jgi:hypothetical protein
MQIVQEPMGQTFERMRNYSTSLSQVAQPLPAGAALPSPSIAASFVSVNQT